MVKPRDPAGWDRGDLLIFLDNNKAQKHHKKLSSKHNTYELQFHNIIQKLLSGLSLVLKKGGICLTCVRQALIHTSCRSESSNFSLVV